MTEPYPYALFIVYKTEKFCFSPKHMELLADGAKLVLSIGGFQVDLPHPVSAQVIDAMNWDRQLAADLASSRTHKNRLDVFEPFSPQSTKKTLSPPRYHLLRVCKKEQAKCKCPHLHGLRQDPAQIPIEQQKAICAYHLFKTCTRGRHCPFFHVDPNQLTQPEIDHMYLCLLDMRRRSIERKSF